MTAILHRDQWKSLPRPRRGRWCAAAAGLAMLFLCGCAERRAKAIPWTTAIRVHPILPAETAATNADFAPQFPLEAPSTSAPLAPPYNAPPRPHVAAPPAEPVTAQKPATPVMAPALSVQEVAAARQEVGQSLAVAQGTLAQIRGRSLNAAQSDTVSKIQSFTSEAQEAASAQDWTRARSLAKKAEVLAEELRSTL